MESKESRGTKNHQVLWATLITLVIGIFAFAQVHIMFTLNQMDDRITRLDNRITRLDDRVNEHLTQIEARLDKLNQNYIDHLEHHLSGK
jgi:septation ring formation regulator EzrA